MYKKLIFPLIALMILVTGIMVFRDYGISWDENTQRNSGIVFFNHIQKTLHVEFARLPAGVPELKDYRDKEFGAAFEVLLFASERLLNLKDYREVFFFRHLVNFIFMWLGVMVFASVISNRFQTWYLPLIACLVLFLSLRIFAESFYNSKDIIVMVFFIFSFRLYQEFSETGRFHHLLLLAFLSAVTFNIRPVGILIPLLAVCILLPGYFFQPVSRHRRNRKLVMISMLPLFFLLFSWLTNPYLWSDPFVKTYAIILKFLNYDVSHTAGNLLFLGQYIPTNQVPWYYLPLWIGISTPLIYLLFLLAGIVFAFAHVFHKKKFSPGKPGLSQDIFITGWLVLPVAAAILFHSTLYDGWRHFYFLWPAMVYVTIHGIRCSLDYFESHGVTWIRKSGTLMIFVVIGSALAWNISTLIRYHPHQYCYFNAIAPDPAKNFELDYWGLSYRDALENLVGTDPSDTIAVRVLNLPGYLNVFLLKPEDRRRVWFDASLRENYSTRVDSYYPFAPKPNELQPGEKPDYYLSNFRDTSTPDELTRYRNHEYPYINQRYSLKYGSIEIMGIYKLK